MELDKPLAIKLLGALLLLALLAVAANDYAASLQPYYFLQDQDAGAYASADGRAREGFLPSSAAKSGVPLPVLVGAIAVVALLLAAYALQTRGKTRAGKPLAKANKRAKKIV